MKIQYTQFALNPALRGTTTNLPAHRAQVLIDSGAAVEVPMPPRGSHSWLQAKAEEEELRVKNIPANQLASEPSIVPVWGVRFIPLSRKHVVVSTSLSGEIIYGANVLPGGKSDDKQLVATLKKAGCPQRVIQQYLDAKSAPDFLAAEAERIEADKRAAQQQQQREREAPRYI
jgi:hypothetical protein